MDELITLVIIAAAIIFKVVGTKLGSSGGDEVFPNIPVDSDMKKYLDDDDDIVNAEEEFHDPYFRQMPVIDEEVIEEAERALPVQPVQSMQPQQVPTALHQPKPVHQPDAPQEAYQQAEFPTVNIDRAGITKFINEQGYLTYLVRSVRIHGYLKSLLSLASLLTQANIYPKASDEVADEVVDMIRAYVE